MQKAAVVYREPLHVGGTADLVRHVRDRVSHVCHAVTLHVQSRALPAEIIAAGGLDTTLAILQGWCKRYPNEPAFAIPAILEKKVAEKKLGRKTGEGFYKWEGDKKQ